MFGSREKVGEIANVANTHNVDGPNWPKTKKKSTKPRLDKQKKTRVKQGSISRRTLQRTR